MIYPGVEYRHVGHFIGNMLTIARMTFGENDFGASHYIDDTSKNVIVFLVWVGVLLLMIIIYLNFIVAEAKSSFERIKKNLGVYLQYEKLSLLNESEDMMPESFKTE